MINMVRIKIKGKKDWSGDAAEADTEDPDFYQTISLSNFNESQNTKPSSNEHGTPHEVSAKVMANDTCFFQQPSMLQPLQSQMQSQFNDFDNMAMHRSHQQETADATFLQQFRGEINHRQHDPNHFRRFSDMTASPFATSSFARNVSDAASERYYRNNQAPMSQTTQSSPHVPPPRYYGGNNIHGHMRFQPEQSDYASSLVHRKLERDIIQRQYNSNFTPSNFFRKKNEASMICGGCSDYSQPLRAGESSNARKFGSYVNDGEASSFAHRNSGRFNMENVPESMLPQIGNRRQEAYSSCDDFSKFIGDTIQDEEADNHGN